MPGKLQVIVGGQYGSEAKGHVTAFLARQERRLSAVRVAGPNAGHTVYGGETRYALRQLPVAAISNPDANLVLAAGSEIDYSVLEEELVLTSPYGTIDRLYVDGEATVIDESHVATETSITTGTTGKGIGAARADRLLRRATLAYDTAAAHGLMVCDTKQMLERELNEGGTVQIEGTQGFGLGQHSGFYPHATSSDCRAVDFMAMAGISPWSDLVGELEIWIVYRTYPIRIAGNSGPMYKETSWEELAKRNPAISPEFTTVTKKMRRVGEWDRMLATQSLRANGAPSSSIHVALMFLDYLVPSVAEVSVAADLSQEAHQTLTTFENLLDTKIELVGTGPSTIVDLRVKA